MSTAFANLTANGAGQSIVAAVSGKKLRILSLLLTGGDTATTVTFTSNAAAITHGLSIGPYSGAALNHNPNGWFETVAGEALKATVSAGSAQGVTLTYAEVL